MNYIKALKIYNDRKGEKNEWCVYKKGTPEYAEVLKIMKDYKEKSLKANEEIKASNIISNAIKVKKAKEELEKLKAQKAELELKKNPDLNKIIEIPEKSKSVTADQYVDIKDNIDRDIEKYLPLYLPLFNMNDLLGLLGFTREDIKRLNIFLTPMTIAEELINTSSIYQQYNSDKNFYSNKKIVYDILEPTAATGNLIAQLVEEKPEIFKIDAVEINKALYEIGKARFKNFNNINWYNKSFFDFKPNKKYDYIFMNPPFNINIKGKKVNDIDFINECYKLLKEDGKLCAIISNTYIKNKQPKYKKFKEFVEDNGIEYEINEGFKEDKTIMKEMQTKVKMMGIIINKNEEIESIF